MDEWVLQAEVWVGQAERWIRQQPPEQIYVAVAVIAVTIVLLLAVSCLKSSKPNTIVLSGLSGGGKSIIFYQLRDGSSHQGTVISIEQNNETFVFHSELERKSKIKPVHVIDVPGHARLKPKLDEVLPQAAGIVFVVDAQDFLSTIQPVAEYLYDILTKATVVKKRIPVLIFCNKTDKVTAHSKEFIKKQLEKEINKLRESRKAISSADITDEVKLGNPAETFDFSQCQNRVTVAEGAGLTGFDSNQTHQRSSMLATPLQHSDRKAWEMPTFSSRGITHHRDAYIHSLIRLLRLCCGGCGRKVLTQSNLVGAGAREGKDVPVAGARPHQGSRC